MEWLEIKTRLGTLDTVCLCHAKKSVRVLDPSIHPLSPGRKLCGVAHTVTCRDDDNLTLIKALHESHAGEVLVVNAAGSTRAIAGEVLFLEAGRKTIAGVIINGGVQDIGKMRNMQLPIYARFTTPLSASSEKLFETQVPATFGDIIINPGDILFGDDDGVVVMTKDEAAEILPIAEKIQVNRQKLIKQMTYDQSLFTMINFDEHCAALAAGQPSTLHVKGTTESEGGF